MKTAIVYDPGDGNIIASAAFETEALAQDFGSSNVGFGRSFLISDVFASPDTHCVADGVLQPLGPDQARELLWRKVRSIRRALLADSDWIVTRSTESGTAAPPAWQAYRQALRDITTQSDPASITWPSPP